MARAADIADHTSAIRANSATVQRVPPESLDDSATDERTAGAIPTALPASLVLASSTVCA